MESPAATVAGFDGQFAEPAADGRPHPTACPPDSILAMMPPDGWLCPELVSVIASGLGRAYLRRLQQRHDLRSSGGIAEADQRQSGIAPHHDRGVIQHLQKCLVESCVGCAFTAYILTHDPGVGSTDFFDGVSREAHQVRIPAVTPGHDVSRSPIAPARAECDAVYRPEIFGQLSEAAAQTRCSTRTETA